MMSKTTYRENIEQELHEYIEQLNRLGFNGMAIFQETGYLKYNKLDYINDEELCYRIQSLAFFIDGVRGKFKKKF